MSERYVVKQIRVMLDSLGAYQIKHWGGPYSTAGVPDILACLNGRFVAIEVKDGDTLEPSKLQAEHIRRIRAAGGIAFHTGSLRDCIEKLGSYERDIFSTRLRDESRGAPPGGWPATAQPGRTGLLDGDADPGADGDADASAPHAAQEPAGGE